MCYSFCMETISYDFKSTLYFHSKNKRIKYEAAFGCSQMNMTFSFKLTSFGGPMHGKMMVRNTIPQESLYYG